MNKVLAQITMNAGDGIPGSVIKYNLKKNASRFDRVIVVDGDLTDEARQFYNQFSNLNVVDSPWCDSYVNQYRAWSDKVDIGDWVLYLDCDEVPSEELLSFLESDNFGVLSKKYNTLCLPCVLHLTEDGKTFHPAEDEPKKEYEGQWMKNILVLKDRFLDFKYFGSHVIPTHNHAEKGHYIPFPYYHMKTLESFVYNDVWQAYLDPKGQQYSFVDANMFALFTKQYPTTKDFKDATRNGEWSPALKKFAWDRRKKTDNPVSRLAWVYHILEENPMPENDEFMTWKNVKKFVLDEKTMNVYKEKRESISV